ncbi:protein transport protein sec31 [Drosophila subpulchrella]|uniref:protein transport protein sec31 n=1 Tax=Drosophila subpulchrella TaxID=1486046 RepID=UPI0018A17B6B|nr:protein transport protein sec31 [Drosophila subpulchrella]
MAPPPLPPLAANIPQPPLASAPPPPPTGQNIAPSGAFPGSLTPGWNDPPPLAGDALTPNANNRRPRLDLRKRVAHPLDGKSTGLVSMGPPPMDAASPRPVAMVPPHRQSSQPELNHTLGGSPDVFVGGAAPNANANANPMRLPPLPQAIGIDSSKVPVARVPVAKVPPRQK